jgi:hypothetical protein
MSDGTLKIFMDPAECHRVAKISGRRPRLSRLSRDATPVPLKDNLPPRTGVLPLDEHLQPAVAHMPSATRKSSTPSSAIPMFSAPMSLTSPPLLTCLTPNSHISRLLHVRPAPRGSSLPHDVHQPHCSWAHVVPLLTSLCCRADQQPRCRARDRFDAHPLVVHWHAPTVGDAPWLDWT